MPVGVIAAGVGAAGVIGAAAISSNASGNAAKAAQQGANTATAEQQREYNQSRADLQPWLSTGTAALGQLSNLYGLNGSTGAGAAGGASADPNATFYQSPDYQFTLGQGIKGVDAGAAARGSLDSGATRKAEISYAGNLASSQYNTYANRLASLAGVGQTAANTDATTGANAATNISNIATNAANNQASSYLAQGNSYASSIGQLAGIGSGLITNLYSPGGTTAQQALGNAFGSGVY